jgi:hypothetical protein
MILHIAFIPVFLFWLLMLRKSQVAIMIFCLLTATLSDLNLKQTHYNFNLKLLKMSTLGQALPFPIRSILRDFQEINYPNKRRRKAVRGSQSSLPEAAPWRFPSIALATLGASPPNPLAQPLVELGLPRLPHSTENCYKSWAFSIPYSLFPIVCSVNP